jgi:two-component sensor histidine kinase
VTSDARKRGKLLQYAILILLGFLALVVALSFLGFRDLSDILDEERTKIEGNIGEQSAAFNRVIFAVEDLLDHPAGSSSGESDREEFARLARTVINHALIPTIIDPASLKAILEDDPLFLADRLAASNARYRERVALLEADFARIRAATDAAALQAERNRFLESARDFRSMLRKDSQLFVQVAGAYHAANRAKIVHLGSHVFSNLMMFTVLSVLLAAVSLLFFQAQSLAERELKLHRDHLAELVGLRTEELNSANRMLSEALSVKETLIKEIHHRVKNNLTMISGLVMLQQSFADPQDLDRSFEGLSDRIQAISLIHEKLYGSADLASVPIGEYLADLCATLNKSVYAAPEAVSFAFGIAPEIRFPPKAVVPIGLIVTELVTNSLKYAFADRSGGIIGISLAEAEEDWLLTVRDDGKPPADARVILQSKSLGVALVKSLVAQLGGALSLDLSAGTTFSIRFPRRSVEPNSSA